MSLNITIPMDESLEKELEKLPDGIREVLTTRANGLVAVALPHYVWAATLGCLQGAEYMAKKNGSTDKNKEEILAGIIAELAKQVGIEAAEIGS